MAKPHNPLYAWRMIFCAVILAAGAGARAGDGEPKQWRLLAGKPVLRWSVEALLCAGAAPLVIVVPEGLEGRLADALDGLGGWRAATGGPSRFHSVLAGLAQLEAPAEVPVLIHDAARPFVTHAHVAALINALQRADGAIPALPLTDTLKRRGTDGRAGTVERAGLWRAQTPQAFRLGMLRDAAAAWAGAEPPTDDAALIEAAGGKVVLVPGDPRLIKLTFAEDLAMAESLAAPARLTLVGQGFDAHRFGPGEAVWLCGVRLSHERSLLGHSDADAGLHALTDAILGALGEGDIGDHFAPADPRWRGAPSSLFLEHAVALVSARGGRLLNADVTLLCEAPKIKPHRAAMRERVAQILALPVQRVSVKATTTDGLGFLGRGEGLAAQAVASLEIPA